MTLQPGWLERQFAAMVEERETFPLWLRRMIEGRKDAEAAKTQELWASSVLEDGK